MRLSSARINWITLFSILTLLISSVVSSAPLMSFQMLKISNPSQSIQPSEQAQMPDCHGSSLHVQMDHGARNPEPHDMSASSSQPCDSSAESMHNCCSATCVNVMAFIPSLNNVTHFETRLSRIEALTQGERVHRPQSLYRPPIA